MDTERTTAAGPVVGTILVTAVMVGASAIGTVACRSASTASRTTVAAETPMVRGGTPQATMPGTTSPVPAFPALAAPYVVCASADGWLRPEDDAQRAHLRALGGDFDRLAGSIPPFAGDTEYVNQELAYRRDSVFWFMEAPEARAYAIAASGLWAAPGVSGVVSNCGTGDGVAQVLLLDYEAVAAHREDRVTQLFFITVRARPGHYEIVQFDRPACAAGDRIGFSIDDDGGRHIAGCCM